MDLTSEYCFERQHLQQCGWDLVSKLNALTERLMMLVGIDHAEFMETKARCEELRQEIDESHDRLLAHRAAHNC